MARPLTKQKELLIKIFNENYHRKVNAPFGVLASPRNFKHDGVDYGANIGEPLYPIHDHIEVLKIVNNVNQTFTRTTYSEKDFGNYVIYYVPSWDVSVLYAHMNKVFVGVGKHGYVKLGESGRTGLSTGAHLHLGFAKGKHSTLSSIRKNGIDFEKWTIPNSKPTITNELINDVILGKYGNGAERKRNLEKAGYNYDEVQDAVNRSYGAKPQTKPKPKPKPQSNKVTVKKTATHFSTGQKMDNWVKGSTFDVIQKGKTTTLIGRGNSVIGWVRDSDLVGSVPKPQSKIGKYANFKGNVRLFAKSRGDACYHATKNMQNNVHTNVRATSAKILDEDNGRVLVSVPRFNPNKVWIANSESTVSDKPKYNL